MTVQNFTVTQVTGIGPATLTAWAEGDDDGQLFEVVFTPGDDHFDAVRHAFGLADLADDHGPVTHGNPVFALEDRPAVTLPAAAVLG